MADPGAVRLTKTDAWILAAIGSEKPIPLDHVVSSADYLNRAIPTNMEVEEAVKHLTMAGLAKVDDRRFRLTKEGRSWLKRFGWESRGVILVWTELADAWDGQELPMKDAASDYRLMPGELEAAVARHHQVVQEWLAKRKREKGQDDQR